MSWFSKSGVADTSAPEPASRSPDCLFLVSTVSYVIDIYLKYNDSVVHLPRGWWFLRIHKSLRLCQHSTGFVWLGERPVGFSNVIAAIPLTPGRLKIPIYYSPRRRPVPRSTTPFPSLPSRETWPYRREVIGGWTITPFGGRGRFRGEMVEVEGLVRCLLPVINLDTADFAHFQLGIQCPEVHSSGEIVPFSIQLWSTSETALGVLGHPDCFDVTFVRSDMYGLDILRPTNKSRHHRALSVLSHGRIWKAGEKRPPLCQWPEPKEPHAIALCSGRSFRTEQPSAKTSKPKTLGSFVRCAIRPSRFQQVYTHCELREHEGRKVTEAENADEESTLLTTPNPSFEDVVSCRGEGKVVRLDGNIRTIGSLTPSFRYSDMGYVAIHCAQSFRRSHLPLQV